MSTALTTMQEELAEELKSLSKTINKPSGFTISTRNKQFSFPDGTQANGPITAIILDWRNVNMYYPKVYNQNNPENPECYAQHKVIKEMAPDESVEKKQHDNCEDCPMNEFGSATTGRGKACKNTVKLAVVAADATSETQPWILNVPPSSISGWSKFVLALEQQFGMLPVQVAADISFDPNESYPKLIFSNPAPHNVLELAASLRAAAQPLLNQTPSA